VNDAALESFGAQTVTNTVAATDITEAAITITAPVTGATPVTTATTSGTGYTCSAVTWTPTVTDGKFLGSTGYTASVTLTAASGYQFSIPSTQYKINDDSANPTNVTATNATLSYSFANTAGGGGGNPGVPSKPDEPKEPVTPVEPEPEDPVDEPKEPDEPNFDIDDGDGEEPPAVVVPIDPDRGDFDTDTGVETVVVPARTLTPEAVAAAVEAALAAGTEPMVEFKIDSPVDAVTGQPAEVREVRVKISVDDLKVVAESEAENVSVKIVSEAGEITLNADALRDLIAIAQADEQASATVEIVVAKNAEARPEELTPAQRETLNNDLYSGSALYDVSAVINESKIGNFNTSGKLTIGLPYELKPGEIGERVASVYIAPDGTTERMTEGRSYSRGLAIFKTNHLSLYAVAYESETQTTEPPEEEEEEIPRAPGGGCDAGFGAARIIVLLTCLSAALGRGRKD
jgi:hypothetical protein